MFVGMRFVLPARALANRSLCCCRKRAVRLQPCRDRVTSRGQADSRQARAWVWPSPNGFILRFSSSRHYHRKERGRETERQRLAFIQLSSTLDDFVVLQVPSLASFACSASRIIMTRFLSSNHIKAFCLYCDMWR